MYYMEKEDLFEWVDMIEEHWTFEKKIPTLEYINKITPQDIQSLFKNVFRKENLSIYWEIQHWIIKIGFT